MTPITQLYWIRVVLGVISGAITAVVFLLHSPNDITSLVNGFTVALIMYLVTYYILKAQFKNKIEKQAKILSTAIAMYFFSWLSFFVLFYTIIWYHWKLRKFSLFIFVFLEKIGNCSLALVTSNGFYFFFCTSALSLPFCGGAMSMRVKIRIQSAHAEKYPRSKSPCKPLRI